MLMKHKKKESINESKDENYKYSNFMDMISPIEVILPSTLFSDIVFSF